MNRARILVVEDEGLVAKDIRFTLEDLGYQVIATVGTGEDALRTATDEHPDVVLMDIRLRGEMDGVEAARNIRSELHIPVIYLTAHSDPATLGRATRTHPFGYVLKPFEAADLRVAIEVALQKHQSDQRIRRHEQLLTAILGGLDDAVIGLDAQGRIQFLNASAARMLSIREGAATGKPLLDEITLQIPGEPPETASDLIDRIVRDGDARHTWRNGTARTKSGRTLPVDGTLTAQPATHDASPGAILVLRDRSLEAQVRELTAERDRLQDALRKRAGELI